MSTPAHIDPDNPYPQSLVTTIEVVFPSMCNQFNTLFGGVALQWMDRAAWICATRFARQTVVTIASDKIVFKSPIREGDMVELRARVIKLGKTSVTCRVDMYSERPLTGRRQLATHGDFVMVAIDADGRPSPVTPAI